MRTHPARTSAVASKYAVHFGLGVVVWVVQHSRQHAHGHPAYAHYDGSREYLLFRAGADLVKVQVPKQWLYYDEHVGNLCQIAVDGSVALVYAPVLHCLEQLHQGVKEDQPVNVGSPQSGSSGVDVGHKGDAKYKEGKGSFGVVTHLVLGLEAIYLSVNCHIL